MVGKTDIPLLLAPFGSLTALKHVIGLIGRHALDRLRHKRGTRLIMGNALVARLLYSLRRRDIPLLFETQLEQLIVSGGRVTRAVLRDAQGPRSIRVRKGVVLATGGIAWNEQLRTLLFPEPARRFSLAPESNSGDGIAAALQAGAGLDDNMQSPALWMPSSVMQRPDGTASVYPHIILDRAKPGLIAVNSAGRRFVNEADSYHDFVAAMLRAHQTVPSIPAFLICDGSFIRDYGLGLVHPGTRDISRFLESGYLKRGDTLAALAQAIGVDAKGLQDTVARHNAFAYSGVEDEFGRGSSLSTASTAMPITNPIPACARSVPVRFLRWRSGPPTLPAAPGCTPTRTPACST